MKTIWNRKWRFSIVPFLPLFLRKNQQESSRLFFLRILELIKKKYLFFFLEVSHKILQWAQFRRIKKSKNIVELRNYLFYLCQRKFDHAAKPWICRNVFFLINWTSNTKNTRQLNVILMQDFAQDQYYSIVDYSKIQQLSHLKLHLFK